MSESNLKNRYDFIILFDVKDGNPNGDPDAGNLPRIDSETGEGLVTDVCLKRKIRNFVQLTQTGRPGYDIFVKEKAILNNSIAKAYADLNIKLDENDKKAKGKKDEVDRVRAKMCEDYFDIRTFGAVMSTGANAGQVRGPVQLTFARSIDPVVILEHSITRMAVATEEEAEKQSGDNRTMGRKNTVSYGLYAAYGFISPALAAQTGFTEADLELLWKALTEMFDHDHSAARGMMATQKLFIFKHDTALGNAPSNKLFDLINITRKADVAVPRKFADYSVNVDKSNLPNGVELIEK
ncbi:MAG: type I-C CRISPR-associated protein Cas7/Csd2 [Lentisphaerae bacterium]|nr:type I-C CRISPR-associated protein Cas7/Csd2 [Lentisphaerota bacterium]